ncbi:MAG TPA: signal peptide peptidase SppA [Candidatus Desulfovibrio intestinipullorum]|uniref:Signal peptide peptidase SppA n=1 Tax=Candidatus Desulfovibrio intestinipullorum TaxID=2838536 RepID=A0A9D1PWN7_9BACT|nr:signal peptide peptidase SppA [Candidatus Desulfovibrio intestinipullorum]
MQQREEVMNEKSERNEEAGKDFLFQKEHDPGRTIQPGCPLAQIPASVWKDILRPPFRKRHPVLWIVSILVVLALAGSIVRGVMADGESLGEEPALGLVSVKGAIMDVSKELAWVDRLAREESIRGVLVRVDSPGGGAAASQELYNALCILAKAKPVAVSMGSVAASGGLMVSMAGQRVFANASTVTGSIGVRMDIPQVQKLMDTLGLGKETLTTAPYKDAGSPLRPLSATERAYFEGVLQDMHTQFVEIVARGRNMPVEEAAKLADGRIFTGRDAMARGLVDEIGGMDAALDWLCAQTGVDRDRRLVRRPEDGPWLQRQLSVMLGAGVAQIQQTAAEGQQPAFLFQW